MIHLRTPELHNLLDAVSAGRVVHHSGDCGAWPTGWSWIEGGHMTPQAQADLDSLHRHRLVQWECSHDTCGDAAYTTTSGQELLEKWDTDYPKGSAA
jgi:hypothetical protein